MSHVFGPVPSRRLGRSLGVDLVPFKTCTYDCVYCQLGRTTNRTIERREWFPLGEIIEDVRERLSAHPDYITLAGSGEPTLYSRIGDLIEGIRSMTDVPVAVLTNGSLLWDRQVRKEIVEANLIVPSLDAGSARLFQAVNRPHPDISFEQMLDGLIAMKQEFNGSYWLEVFLLQGYTAMTNEVREIARCVSMIGQVQVQINTVTRPPAEDYASGVDRARMERLAGLFDPRAEVIADYRDIHARPEFTVARDTVLRMIERRPCTLDDISSGLGIHPNETSKHLGELLAMGLIEQLAPVRGRSFFRVRTREEGAGE